MNGKRDVSRRTFLRGLGTTMAVPLLDAASPTIALARATAEPPKRVAFVYIPNGVHMQEWTPARAGSLFTLPRTLEPLKPFQNDLLVLSGLAHDKARANADGGGDHARSASAFLTGAQPVKTRGADIRLGTSVDQIAAEVIGNHTRIRSLEVGCDPGTDSGSCDSGYSCAYTSNISWRSENQPMAKDVDPRVIFERLFTNGNAGETTKRNRYRKSILDFVLDDARRLERQIGVRDRRKLDEYFNGVREIERRLEFVEKASDSDHEVPADAKPTGVPKELGEHFRLLADMIVLAFQSDATRVCSFMVANAGSDRNYSTIDVPEGHHELSHHGGDARKIAKICKINRYHIEQFAYLLGKLKAAKEGDGTLLDNCMIVYGSGLSDGNRHNHENLPVLLAGRGGGTIDTGRHVRYAQETPLTNLYTSLLDRLDVPVEFIGDSTGRLDGLTSGGLARSL